MSNFKTHEQYAAFENIRFKPECLKNLLGVNIHNGQAVAVMNEENVDPNENFLKCREQNHDVVYTREELSQNIFYILKNWKCHRNDQTKEYVSLGRKPTEYPFEVYIKNVIDSINELEKEKENNPNNLADEDNWNINLQREIKRKQEEVHSLLLDIFELISLLHCHRICMTTISLDNIIVCASGYNLKLKIIDLDVKTIADNATESYTKDIKNLGKLFLSIVVLNDMTTLGEILKAINNKTTYDGTFEYIFGKISNINWIEPFRKKLLADLVLYLLKIDDCDCSTILNFILHPFFWDERNIEDFLRIINCRIDLQDKEKDEEVTKFRIEELNTAINYNDWNKTIGTFLSEYIQQPTDKTTKILKCNDLIKFIRNKIAHKDDDTDNESICVRKQQSKATLARKLTISKQASITKPPNPKKAKKNEKKKNLRELWKFFDDRGGPLSYFLLQFPELLYQLFNYFRTFEHKKIMQFYPICFRKVLPEEIMMPLNLSRHPPINHTWKNKSIFISERVAEIQRTFNSNKNN